MYMTYRAECVDTWQPQHVAEWLTQIGVAAGGKQREAVEAWLNKSGAVDGKALLALPLKTEQDIAEAVQVDGADLDRVTTRNLFANLKHLRS